MTDAIETHHSPAVREEGVRLVHEDQKDTQTVAVVFTDIVGSTELASRLGPARAGR
jgi:class 3 adenylate cyclase